MKVIRTYQNSVGNICCQYTGNWKDNLTRMIKDDVDNRTTKEKRSFKIRKVKALVGKSLLVYAALPLFSFWAAVPGMMLCGIKPTLWAKTKLIDFKERWRLR